jgi:KUP system potassium uptake protein
MIRFQRHLTEDMKPGNLKTRSFLERNIFPRMFLSGMAMFGVSLIISDGILTPAQSVLGAIQGLNVIRPDLGLPAIVGITCAILVFLYAIQPLGVEKISVFFAPVIIIWLLFNFTFGIYNLATKDHSVLKAFSPYYAGEYFVRNKTEGWKSLGGILLCFTGVEALFADLGAFSKRAIQISWLCFAYPCLLLAYIGESDLLRDIVLSSYPFALFTPLSFIHLPSPFRPSYSLKISNIKTTSPKYLNTLPSCFNNKFGFYTNLSQARPR